MRPELQRLADYLAGDLTDQEREGVREELAADPELRALYVRLRGAQVPMVQSPADIAWDRPEPQHRGSPVWIGGVALAAALFLLGLLALPGIAVPEGQLAIVARTHQANPESQRDFIVESDPKELAVAFEARGLAPSMAMVADLQAFDLRLAGGQLEGDGAVVVYVDSLGRRFECHMLSDGPTGEPSSVLQRAGAPDLQVHAIGPATAVVWREHGMICVLVSEHHEAVLALAQAKVWGSVG